MKKSYDSLLEIRERLGMKQKELAEAIGVDPNYISMIESGKKPFSKKLLQKIELYLAASKTNEPAKTLSCATDGCPECARLRVEVSRLNMIIDKLVSR